MGSRTAVKVSLSYHVSCFCYSGTKKEREENKLEANRIDSKLMIVGEKNSMCVVFVTLLFVLDFQNSKYFFKIREKQNIIKGQI